MSKRVLLLESDPAFAGAVKRRLERAGIEVEVTEDGNHGCELAVSHRPSLILLTVELPQMNGFLVCKKLKKAPESAGIPIIILSSDATEEIFEAHRNLRTRADVYLKKPISVEALMDKVRAFIPVAEGTGSELSLMDMEAMENPGATEIASPGRHPGLWSDEGSAGAAAAVPPQDRSRPRMPGSVPPPLSARIEVSRSLKLDEDLAVPGTGVRPREASAAFVMPSSSTSGTLAAVSTASSSGSLAAVGSLSQPPRGRDYLELRETLNRKERELLDTKDTLRTKDREILDLRDKSIRLERELADEQAGQLALERELESLREAHANFELDRNAWGQRIEAAEARAHKAEQDIVVADTNARRQITRLEAQLAETEQRAQQEVASVREALVAELDQARHTHGDELRRFRVELENQKQVHLETLQQRATEFDALRAEALAKLEASHAEAKGELEKDLQYLNQKVRELEATRAQESEAHARRMVELDQEKAREAEQQLQKVADLEAALQQMRAQVGQTEKRASDLGEQLTKLRQRKSEDDALLERVRRAMAIGASLLEEQRNQGDL